MPEESKEADPPADEEALKDVINEATTGAQEEGSGDDEPVDPSTSDAIAANSAEKKKKSKREKIKSALIGDKNADSSLSNEQLQQVLAANPSLKGEMAGMDMKTAGDMLRKLNISDLLTGLAIGGKNQKDMANYKFWQTQPVPSFEEKAPTEEAPIKIIDPAQVPKDPSPLALEGFEWVTMDLTDNDQLREVYELLSNHYVEDDEAMFRFNYSFSFLNWALKSPGWRKEWHVGVRASSSKRLVAFISGIPVALRIRSTTVSCSEINFLCIHKRLRSKRLAPVLIKEITRRCYAVGVFQAIYTAGVVLPRPVASCRYFHRSLDWTKLWEVGFCGMPGGSTKERQVRRYKLPDSTSTKGLREMEAKDVDTVLNLLKRYLKRVDMAQEFTKEEVNHWLLHDDKMCPERVIWSYVVEDPATKQITDFFSFYCLESTVIGTKKHPTVRAAYLYHYATETAFQGGGKDTRALKERLNPLMNDALILAKKANFDVVNALTLLDNPLFLEQQKFGAGDGQLHYYLYNYRAAPIPGGVDQNNHVDERFMGGIGVVML